MSELEPGPIKFQVEKLRIEFDRLMEMGNFEGALIKLMEYARQPEVIESRRMGTLAQA